MTHGSPTPNRSPTPDRSHPPRRRLLPDWRRRYGRTGTTVALALPLAGALGLQACGPTLPPQVIAGDGVLCDITQRLAGGDLRVACLLQPGDDPHQFRLTPQQSRELSQAQLVLINGYGLTPALAALVKAGPTPTRAVAVAERAVPDSPALNAPSRDGVAHGHGDRDPHVWHDPSQAAALVRLVAGQLAELKPQARSQITARAQAMTATLQQLDAWNRRQLATISGTPVLATGHRAFASLARAYGLQERAVVDGTSSSDTLRPQAFQTVVQQLRRDRVPMLFSEQLPATKALQRISQLSGVPMAPQPVVADGLAPDPEGRSSLVATLSTNTCRIVAGLRGRCDQAGQRSLITRWQAIH